MTSLEQGGVTGGVGGGGDDRGGGGDDDERRERSHDDTKDTEAVKEKVVTAATEKARTTVEGPGRTRKQVRIPSGGGFLARSLAAAGAKPRVVTSEIRQAREAEGIATGQARQEAERSIADEFWAAFGAGPNFDRSPISSGRHLEGGTDPDDPTIKFFKHESPEAWLVAQSRGAFALARATSETHGPSIGFTVYFLTDRDPRRSVAGHYQRGRFVIVHIGPVQ